MRKLLVGLLKSFALLFYFVSYSFPRKKNVWLFGESTGFNNNSKYLFLYVLKNYPEIKAIWIGRERKIVNEVRGLGYNAYHRYSIKGLWACLTSKYYIVSTVHGCINFWTSGGAKIINLWHGVGWKACLWSNPIHRVYKEKGLWENYWHMIYNPHLYFKPDLLLSTSPFMTKHFFAPMFNIPEERCVEDYYPRCYFMLKPKEEIIDFLKHNHERNTLNLLEQINHYKHVIFYAPTFRDEQYDFFKESGIDFKDLNQIMRKDNSLFLIKCHPSTRIEDVSYLNHSNIMVIDKNADSYNIMPFTDLLISDYSSIVFDYLLLKKPILLYPFDMDKYNDGSRPFAFKYEDIVEGIPIVRTYTELRGNLSNIDKRQMNDISKIWSKTGNLVESIMNLK